MIVSNHKFLIRLKDDDSNGIISTYAFTYDKNHEFDCYIEPILTWKQTNEIKRNWETYTYVARGKFDFYEDNNPYFPMRLRILCIEVSPGVYEYLATNLDQEEFPPSMIKELYHYRWAELYEPCSYTNFSGRNTLAMGIPAIDSSYKPLR